MSRMPVYGALDPQISDHHLLALHQRANGRRAGRLTAIEDAESAVHQDDRILDIWGQALGLESRSREVVLRVLELIRASGVSVARVCTIERAMMTAGVPKLGKKRIRDLVKGRESSAADAEICLEGFVGDWYNWAGEYLSGPVTFDGRFHAPNPTHLLAAAIRQVQSGLTDQALSSLRAYAESQPFDPSALSLIARLAVINESADAVDLLQDPELPRAWSQEMLGYVYLRTGQLDAAVQTLLSVQELEPWRPTVLSLLMHSLRRQGNLLAMVRATRRFVKGHSRFFDPQFRPGPAGPSAHGLFAP